MKALILAAGYGTRLEPLTLAVPKPMVPIVNLPTMQHNLELLKEYGFDEVIANIHYYPEQIENYFRNGESFGIKLAYSYEKELLGTAGGVKKMAQGVDETFLVLSSDALTDINLSRLVAFHKEKKALATMALAKVSDVREFGVVVQDPDGRVVGFQEKPSPEVALSDLANAGIYVFEPEILDMIPEGFYDFGKQLFPIMIERKMPIYGYQMVEYWSDVGGLDKYIQANYDAMKGLVKIKIPGEKTSASTWIGRQVKIDPSACFEGSVIVGDHCVIGKDVYIKDAVIGSKCVIENGAVVTGSVLWSDTIVCSGAQIDGAVIGSFCHVGERAKVLERSILANRCVLRPSSVVPPSSRLVPDSIA